MTNSRMTPEPAGPHEEVQLTELRPVEHSRIEPEPGDSDTDGLRALRSFSSGHHDGYLPQPEPQQTWPGDRFDPERSDGFDDSDEYVNGDFEYMEGRDEEDELLYERLYSKPSPEPRLEREPAEQALAKPGVAPRPSARPRGRPKKKKLARAKKPEPEDAAEPLESADLQSEKELQSKINEIIKANYLLERENNNVVERRSPVKHKDKDKDELRGQEQEEEEEQALRPDELPAKKYRCALCDARFKGSGGLRNHYKVVHSRGPLFKCDECGKEFPLKERLKLHVRTHTGFKPYKCDECDKSFARGGQLAQHRRTHSQLKPYSCELCSGTFTCAANLALHVKRHNGQKDHKCDICGRGFVRRDALKKHLECLHRDVKSFLCSICNKTFKGHLPQHMRTHVQDRPHGCATCGQRFAQKSQLTVHQRTHSGQRPFRCLVCWQAFAHSTALKLHTRRHTGERPFKCGECSAGFTQLPHWKKHMKCIHGRSEPYCCRRCNSFFRIKSELDGHEKQCTAEAEAPRLVPLPVVPVAAVAAAVAVPAAAAAATNPTTTTTTSSTPTSTSFASMSIEKMRLLVAVLLKRISKQERLDELGFGKRLIDQVLVDSLLAAGKRATKPGPDQPSEFDALRANLALFLEWTVPKEHWDNFRSQNKSPEEVLETLTLT